MLRTYVLNFGRNWDEYQSTIGMPLFEALSGRKYRSPIYSEEVGDRRIFGPYILQEATNKIKLIKERTKAA